MVLCSPFFGGFTFINRFTFATNVNPGRATAFLCSNNINSTMPTNKKKNKSCKTKAMKREEKGLPPFSSPKMLCFPPARPKGCTTPLYVRSKTLVGFLVYGCCYPLTSTTCCRDKLTPTIKQPLRPCTNPDGYTHISGRCPRNVLENAKFYRRTRGLELRGSELASVA